MGSYQPPAETTRITDTLKRAAAALRQADIDFALAGSVACWARGGPSPCNDLDIAIRPEQVDGAEAALEAAGMRTERPPEGWLLKAWDDDVLVDLIWEFEGDASIEALLARADDMAVQAVHVSVLALDDVLVSKLCALDEHALDLAGLLAIARSLREQVGWSEVRERTAKSAYARAFLTLLEQLDVIGSEPPARSHQPRVRVVRGA